MTKVKICGVTTVDDALHAVRSGADMLGLNFYEPSPRYVTQEQAREIVQAVRQTHSMEDCVIVGVFVNESAKTMKKIIDYTGIDLAQLSGDEAPETLLAMDGRGFKSIRPKSLEEAIEQANIFLPLAPEGEKLPALLVDAYHPELYGGTGETASTEILHALAQLSDHLMIAGGLKPENVSGRVQEFSPWGVDVASGVEGETKGQKDPDKVRQFIASAKELL